MIIGFTGHRPDRLGGYVTPNPIYDYVYLETEKFLKELNPEKCISGMALGYDQLAAVICFRLNIPVTAAIPFKGQESRWTRLQQHIYKKMLDKTSEQIIVSEGGFSVEKMHLRNKYIVDKCDLLIACYDGSGEGGTAHCVQYATQQNKKIIYINPKI